MKEYSIINSNRIHYTPSHHYWETMLYGSNKPCNTDISTNQNKVLIKQKRSPKLKPESIYGLLLKFSIAAAKEQVKNF